MRRLTLRLTLDCNNACVFCAQKGLKSAGVGAFEEQLRALKAAGDEVTFIGGEPTLVPELPQLVAMAREIGFRAVGLQTNGRRLADTAYLTSLVKAGLTDLHFSLHGPEAAVHDYHVGVPGAFAEVMAAIHHARVNGLVTVATTVLTRSNYRVLIGMPRLLKVSGVSSWLISMPRVAGALAPATDRITPRLGLAMPFALATVSEAAKVGLETWIQGAPACTLGPFVSRLLPEAPRAYAPVCEGCPAKSFCPGVEPAYLQQFHGDELSAKELPKPVKPTALTRLFVGVGELAPSLQPEPAAPAPEIHVTQLGRPS